MLALLAGISTNHSSKIKKFAIVNVILALALFVVSSFEITNYISATIDLILIPFSFSTVKLIAALKHEMIMKGIRYHELHVNNEELDTNVNVISKWDKV